jgi:hypothetical protein
MTRNASTGANPGGCGEAQGENQGLPHRSGEGFAAFMPAWRAAQGNKAQCRTLGLTSGNPLYHSCEGKDNQCRKNSFDKLRGGCCNSNSSEFSARPHAGDYYSRALGWVYEIDGHISRVRAHTDRSRRGTSFAPSIHDSPYLPAPQSRATSRFLRYQP